MIRFFEKLLAALIPGYKEATDETTEHFEGGSAFLKLLPMILSIIISQVLLLLLGKFLWNKYLVNAIEVVNPIESVLQLFGISVLTKLILH